MFNFESHRGVIEQLLKELSIESIEVLLRYPQWRMRVIEAYHCSPLPMDYSPLVVEVFDQQGLLAGRVGDYRYSVEVPFDHVSEFTAWYFDGELVLFQGGGEIVINRLSWVSVAALFERSDER